MEAEPEVGCNTVLRMRSAVVLPPHSVPIIHRFRRVGVKADAAQGIESTATQVVVRFRQIANVDHETASSGLNPRKERGLPSL